MDLVNICTFIRILWYKLVVRSLIRIAIEPGQWLYEIKNRAYLPKGSDAKLQGLK